jgi:transposase-like protein
MQRRKFTREFKLEAVRLIKERGVSFAQAHDLGIHPTQLRDWAAARSSASKVRAADLREKHGIVYKRGLCPQCAPKGKLLSSHERAVFT